MAGDPSEPPDKPPDINISSEKSGGKNSSNEKKTYEKRYFSEIDLGPFEIYIQHKEKNVGNYNILSIAKEVFNLKLEDIIKINRKGKNRIGIIFSNYKGANNFLKNNVLEQKGYEIFIPSHHLQSKGIVRFVDRNLTVEEIKEFSTTNYLACKIIDVRRMNRRVIEKDVSGQDKVNYIPTGTICVTFSGRSIPKEIKIFGLPMKVVPYIEPVLQCQNCFIYGHSTPQCRSKTRCIVCSKIHEKHIRCNVYCFLCKSSRHQANDIACPERIRQKEIKQLMSFQNISYFEAGEKVPKNYNKKVEYKNSSNNYPELNNKNRVQNEEVMSETEKRNLAIMDNQMPTYSQVASTANMKKRRYSNEGYNKTEYNTCLNNPNGRIQENPSTHRRSEVECIQMDVIQAMNSLTDQHRELVMTFIGNIINNFYEIPSNNKLSPNFENKKSKGREEMDCSDESEQFF